jgi:hypothetical protein
VTEDLRDLLVQLATRDRKERRGSLVHPAQRVREAQLDQLALLESVVAKAPKAHRVPKAPVDPLGSLALRGPMGILGLQAHQARMDFLVPRALLASKDCRALWENLGCLDHGGYQACQEYQACQDPRALLVPQAHQESWSPWLYRMSQLQHQKPMVI